MGLWTALKVRPRMAAGGPEEVCFLINRQQAKVSRL